MCAQKAQGACVLTSEVYNKAEAIFNSLQNEEKLVSFLDCLTLLRGMGMNPTSTDMDQLKERMAEPVLRLEQWRREEELKREKERRKEEQKDKKGGGRASTAKSDGKARKSVTQKEEEGTEKKDVKIVPAEEINNIDWNIFISCTEEIYRDAASEEREVYKALKVFREENGPKVMTRKRLIEILTTNGDNILSPAEAKLLETLLPEECAYDELASRIQGTYAPPTAKDLAEKKAEAEELERKQQEEQKKASEEDPLAGL